MRAIVISLLAVATVLTVIGCTLKESPEQQPSAQASSNSSPLPVERSCKSPGVPPANVARKPGYRQFDVSVTNSVGWPVPGLVQQDFVLYAGSQTFPVAYFREHKNDEPVAIALVVDSSGNMAPKLLTVKESLGGFLENLNSCDEASLFAFNSEVYQLQPFSTDHQTAAGKIELLKSYGESALYDGTNAALQRLERTDYPNRKLVLISDGIDNSSTVTLQAVAARAAKDGIPIYAIGIGDPNAPEKSGIAIGPLHMARESYTPSGEPIAFGPSDIPVYQAYVAGPQSAWPATDWVTSKQSKVFRTRAVEASSCP